MAVHKVAISVPEELLAEVERERKRRGLSRSAVIQSGLRAWLRAQREMDRSRRYVRAYLTHPETDREVAVAARLVEATWSGRRSR